MSTSSNENKDLFAHKEGLNGKKKAWWQKLCGCYWAVPTALSAIFGLCLIIVFVLYNANVISKPFSKSANQDSNESNELFLRKAALFENGPLCTSPVCRGLGEAYSKTLNWSVDPCEDFYAFTCAGLQKDYKAHKLGRDPNRLTSVSRLSDAMKEISSNYLQQMYTRSISDKHNSDKMSASDRQMVALFSSCINRNSHKQVARAIYVLKMMLTDVNLPWPGEHLGSHRRRRRDRGLLNSIGRLSLRWGLSTPWLDFRLVPLAQETGKKIIEITALHLPKPALEFNKNGVDLDAKGEPAGKLKWSVFDGVLWIRSCLLNNTKGAAVLTIKSSVEYELVEKKAGLLLDSLNISVTSAELSRMVLHQVVCDFCLSGWVAQDRPNSSIEHIDLKGRSAWKAFLNKHLKGNTRLRESDGVLVRNPVNTRIAIEVLEDPILGILLEDYLVMWLVNVIAPIIGGKVTKAFCSVNERQVCNINDITFCSQKVREYLPLSNAALIGRHIVSNAGLAELHAITDLVKTIVAENIARADWMDVATKQNALRKVTEMMAYLGYPTYFKRKHYKEVATQMTKNFAENIIRLKAMKMRSILKNFHRRNVRNNEVWRKTLMDTNAAYIFKWNGILVPSNSLGLSYYVEGAPMWTNVASSPIGHEIYHAFDISGRRFDAEGNAKNWWTNETMERYQNNVNCFARQYTIPVPFHQHLTFNGNISLSENLADNAGLRALYNAFIVLGRLNRGNLQTLPLLQSLSPEQVFFVAWAYKRCRVLTPELAMRAYHRQTHAYVAHRVNLPLRNLDEFGTAFNCPVGSPMRPAQGKCLVW